MLQQLGLAEFAELAKTAKRVAIYREISADRLTPVGIVERLEAEMNDGVILESGLRHQDAGRYSFIAFGSVAQLSVKNKVVSQRIGQQTSVQALPPLTALRNLIAELSYASQQNQLDFMNAAFGFITYDAIRLFESIPDRHPTDNDLPEMLFNFYQNTLIFDHLQQKLVINIIVEVNNNPEKTYAETQKTLSALIEKIIAPQRSEQTMSPSNEKHNSAIEIDLNDEQFMQLVDRAKQSIISGDAFQIVLSRCFKKTYTATPFNIYRALRQVSPAPYMFYFPLADRVMMGASPEKLISVINRNVVIHPIAGTRPRTQNSHNQQIADELLNDKKERAEHMMLVDLARNDLGAVCNPGSIQVNELMQVKHFSHVSHITSTITGQLQENKDALDALAAAFPAGTLSGAPKIRAMQIIDELETTRRGLYGGAICRIDNQGNLDSCIAIRMAVLKDGVATVRTGAGIVYDSDPKSEANETRHKAQAMLEALRVAEEELYDFNY